MDLVLVTKDIECVKDLCSELKEKGHTVSVLPPLEKNDYMRNINSEIEKERSTVPLYRKELVLYYSRNSWDSLLYTMRKAWGVAIIEPKHSDYYIVKEFSVRQIKKDDLIRALQDIPPFLHMYYRSICDMKKRYDKLGFSMEELMPYLELFIDKCVWDGYMKEVVTKWLEKEEKNE